MLLEYSVKHPERARKIGENDYEFGYKVGHHDYYKDIPIYVRVTYFFILKKINGKFVDLPSAIDDAQSFLEVRVREGQEWKEACRDPPGGDTISLYWNDKSEGKVHFYLDDNQLDPQITGLTNYCSMPGAPPMYKVVEDAIKYMVKMTDHYTHSH